jgi:5-methylcytosine-specific restriction enzyme A
VDSFFDIRPTKRDLVFDLVKAAGVDVSDWIASSKNPRAYRANPKYCYEWSFVEPRKLAVLNLWHSEMSVDNGRVVRKGNFRADADRQRLPGGKSIWAKRAEKMDEALKAIIDEGLLLRVIINDGVKREPDTPNPKASTVERRELDPLPWTITKYDHQTGEHVIARGDIAPRFVDQFDAEREDDAEARRLQQSGSVFYRDPAVRSHVKNRANGKCEYCGEPGFRMEGGAVYLETHHIVPLFEYGPDRVENVIALCPNDHRMAHFAEGRDVMRRKMLDLLVAVDS